jgi:imidazolonepropionase-like amidohydrolase
MKRSSLFGLAAVLAACSAPAPQPTVLVGARLFDGSGADPVQHSVVVVEGGFIRSAGPQSHTPVPAGSEKVNGSGKYLVPAPVAPPEDLRLDEPATVEELLAALDRGAKAFRGVPDGALDPSLLLRLKEENVVVVLPADTIALLNLAALIRSGVTIAVFDEPEAPRARQLLLDAGMSPHELLLASTRNAALVAGLSNRTGQIRAGMAADLLVLSDDPLTDPSSFDRPERIMRGGKWGAEANAALR